ncbi:hypothetical protein C8Q80DRAFT_1218489 [Daedaleopsis nitida]|nr:hypothetical protein C8Q80DRAFT_1218489 [Daedaleopsis nitida]
MVAAWDIYAEQLLPLGYGHPLWVPEPCVEAGQVRIGDVGYLRAGGFRFMFNSTSGGDHPINRRMGIPSGFRVFELPEHLVVRRPNEIIQTQLHSASLRSSSVAGALSFDSPGPSAEATLRYQCSESSGAILLLRRPGNFEFLDCRLRIKAYMLEHFSRWYEFANSTLGIGLQDKEILFVSGFIKTADWAEAAFHSKGTSGELSITGGFQPIAPVSAGFSVSMLRCESPALFYRSGPTRALAPATTSSSSSQNGPASTTETFDQCVFLHYYKMKSRRLWPTIRAAAEPQDLPQCREDHQAVDAMAVDDGAPSEGSDDIESCMGDNEAFDPVGCLLDYILEVRANEF